MIARPKNSRNEWESAELGAFDAGNVAPRSRAGARGQPWMKRRDMRAPRRTSATYCSKSRVALSCDMVIDGPSPGRRGAAKAANSGLRLPANVPRPSRSTHIASRNADAKDSKGSRTTVKTAGGACVGSQPRAADRGSRLASRSKRALANQAAAGSALRNFW